MALGSDITVGVVGAGAMGTGIAQIAAAAGHAVVLADALGGAAQKARANIARVIDREVEKGRRARGDADSLMSRIDFRSEPLGEDLSAYSRCGLIIEAVVEELPVKQLLLRRLESVVGSDTVLATNTSSLSVASIASA